MSLQPFRLRNIHRLLPRLSIRSKLVIAFCLFGVVPLAVVGGYGAIHSVLLLNDAIQDRLKNGVTLKAEEFQRFLQEVEANVLFLSRLSALQALVNLPPEARQEQQRLTARLGEEFLSFSQFHKAYNQVRYIDEHGREIVRADFDGERHYLVTPERLQDKRDRYYFREAMERPPGTVYVSPMDLNIEGGVVETPHKPVVRYAVPLRSGGAERRGIVILNIYASRILSQVPALGREIGDVSLASSDGVYLSRSQWFRGGRDAGGSHNPPLPPRFISYSEQVLPGAEGRGQGPGVQLSRDFSPTAAATILSGQPGTVVEPGLQGRIVAFAPIFPHEDHQGKFWVLVHTFNKAEILSAIRSLRLLVLSLGGAVFVIALWMGVAAARHITRPITELNRGAEAIARGEFDHPIRVETNDELEDLSRQFVRMATHLKEHERQLWTAREHAERKAQEAHILCRIGTEILALLSLPQILQLVADKARDLLKADLAILCLTEPEGGLRVGATSGSPEALRHGPGDLLRTFACGKVVCQESQCPAVTDVPLACHVAVTMTTGGRTVGYLCVAFREPRPAGSGEVEFLPGLANQAAIAIENARLHSEVRKLAVLAERERIGQDLHDGIIQSVYATGLGLEECVKLTEKDPREVRTKLRGAIDSLNIVIRDVRNYIVGLQPKELQEWGLSRSLADLIGSVTLNGLLKAELDVGSDVDVVLTSEQVSELYHICREALVNVVKHAHASRVAVTLSRDDGILLLSVEDDGVGFDPDERIGLGQGLRNMGERARRLQGEFAVTSAKGRGARVAVRLPLEPQG